MVDDVNKKSARGVYKLMSNNSLHFSENIDVTTYIDEIKEVHNPPGKAYASVVWDYFQEGCSVRLLNPAKYNENVWWLCANLQEYFNSLVGANLYLTPAGSQGFAPHFDDIDAFVLQLEGCKRWKVYPPYPPLKTPSDRSKFELPLYPSKNFSEKSDFEGEYWSKPIIDTILQPGDLLYMPRGFVHQANTTLFDDRPNVNARTSGKKKRKYNDEINLENENNRDETSCEKTHSLHLTLSTCQNNTWGQLLQKALALSLNSLMINDKEFRISLPPSYLTYMGFPYDGDTIDLVMREKRKDFKSQFNRLALKVIQNLSPDLSVDAFTVSNDIGSYLRDSLPPHLHPIEKCNSIFDDGDSQIQQSHFNTCAKGRDNRIEKILKGKSVFPKLTMSTRIKLTRFGSFRVTNSECRDITDMADKVANGFDGTKSLGFPFPDQFKLQYEKHYASAQKESTTVDDTYFTVYHNYENDRLFRGTELQSFTLTSQILPVLKHLIRTYPSFISISELPMNIDEEKIDVALSLYEKGIVMLKPRIKNSVTET